MPQLSCQHGGKNKAKKAEYIRHQRAEDKVGEKLGIPYAETPVTGPGNRNADVGSCMRLSWLGW